MKSQFWIYSKTSDVSPPFVTSWTKDPESGLPSDFVAHSKSRSATKSKLVHVEVSAFGIHFLFMGVSNVIGKS